MLETMNPEEEFELYEEHKSWTAIFQRIHANAQKEHNFSLKDARRPEYRNRNRYGDVSPYDHSRVRLHRDGVDYINASLVASPEANRAYILTQGPLPDTAGHFWLMVWEQNSKAILMLNSIIEKGHVKCYQYYPLGEENEDEDEKVFTDVGLKVTYLSELESNFHYKARVYRVQDLESKEAKQVIQFHFTAWLDFAVPDSGAFLDFLFAVRNSGALDDPSRPPVIHCSAGIGRSGTFCLVDTCLVLMQNEGSMEGISVIDILMEMRTYRMGLIQTPQQLRFSYQAIIEGVKRVLIANGSSTLSSSEEEEEEEDEEEEDEFHSNSTELKTQDTDIDQDSDFLPSTPPPIPPRVGPASVRPEFSNPSKHDGPNSSLINAADDSSSNGTDVNNINTSLSNGIDLKTVRHNSENIVANGAVPNEPENNQSNASSDYEIRRRKREERIKNTSELIAKMKHRQKESELWQSRERQLNPYVIGIFAAFAVGGYALYRCYWT